MCLGLSPLWPRLSTGHVFCESPFFAAKLLNKLYLFKSSSDSLVIDFSVLMEAWRLSDVTLFFIIMPVYPNCSEPSLEHAVLGRPTTTSKLFHNISNQKDKIILITLITLQDWYEGSAPCIEASIGCMFKEVLAAPGSNKDVFHDKWWRSG